MVCAALCGVVARRVRGLAVRCRHVRPCHGDDCGEVIFARVTWPAQPTINMTNAMPNPSLRSFTVRDVPVHVFDDKRDMGAAAASESAAYIGEGIVQRGVARIIVGTGNSQNEVIDELKRLPVDWASVEVFHMDEYVGMADTHPASFRRWLRTRVADVVHPKMTYYLAGDAADIDAEAQRYSELLTQAPIDVCFVGFGENGHIAFNDPHVADFGDPHVVKCVDIDERCRMQQVGEGHFCDLDTVPQTAITLTCPALMRALHVIACVPDERKAEAVHNAIEGLLSTNCPASVIFTHPSASVYLDSRSASMLTT